MQRAGVKYYLRNIAARNKIKIYRTIILPGVLYGFETWSLTLREERRLRVFENRVLKRVFGPKNKVFFFWSGFCFNLGKSVLET